jgi:F-type H+-transporting ATPase subunit epsilon
VADKIEFELVAPERLLIEGEFDMIVLPGENGDFGVLPRHAPLISTLRPGTIVIFEDGQITSRIFVAAGFAEVMAERLTVMAEQASPIEEIDRAEVQQAISGLRDDIGIACDESERAVAEAGLVIAEAKLQAIDQPGY